MAAGLLLALNVSLLIMPMPAQAQGTAQSAIYRVTFEGKFTASALAGGVSVPSGEHFTTLIGAVHNGSATFWSSGGTASAGVEAVAELGTTGTFKSEINANSNALAVIEQSIVSGGTATATVDVTLTTDHPLVTLLTMIAPSPDWFAGVSGLSLRNAADDGWQPSLSVDLFPYDAGTEEGTDFSLTNSATSPQGTITSIKGTGKFSNEPIATLAFDLLAAPVITTTSPILVTENETAVATLTASDDDTPSGELTWAIPSGTDGGADADKFTLGSTGVLTFNAAKDYENPDDADTDNVYEVTVQVSDGTNTVTAALQVTVENVIELTTLTEPSSVAFPEKSWSRVATFTASSEEDRAGIAWTLGGTDSGHFSIDSPPGALRFALDAVSPRIFSEPPDFEVPVDGGADNTYELTLSAAADGSVTETHAFTVTVTDVDEEGALSLSSTRPALGSALTAVLTDPDGVTDGTAVWQWERSTGRNAWAVIDGAAAASYTPVAADTNAFLRVTATYADEHGTGKAVSEVAPNVVTGHLLTGLTASTDNSRADGAHRLYPAFDPETLHYGIGCNSADTLAVTASAAANARVSVAGVQAGSASTSVAVSEDSDVAIRVTDATGAVTTYVVHCLRDVFFEIETHTFPNTDAFEDLILFSREGYFRLMDRYGVPRLRRSFADVSTFASRFHRVGVDGAYRYGFRNGGAGYTILDEDFKIVAEGVRTVSPLNRLDSHDFQILEDGNYLFMAYEPATRDFSGIDLPYADGADVSSVDVRDSAIQIVTPQGQAVFNWNSWDYMALEDCVQHLFPLTLTTDPDARAPDGDYAHINGMHVVDGVLAASMRGCSKVLGIDVATGDVVWRMGRTNLSDAEWAARDIGPPPLDFVDDPEGEFCGQHTARFLPNGNVFLFDNGVACAIDPWTFETLGRDGNDFSRAVEYALDLDNHEAVFVRDHSLRGERSHFGGATGNVDALDNGDWLVSWGRSPDEDVRFPDNEMATLVDPATGQEKLGIRFRELPSNVRQRRVNATAVPAEALAPQPVPLAAEFPASEHTSGFHTGVGDAPQVVVAFNRPVVDFDASSPSLRVAGGTVVSVSPLLAAGEAANAYVVVLRPDGDGPVTVSVVSGQACTSSGVCTADGAVLPEGPSPAPATVSTLTEPPEIGTAGPFSVDEGTTSVATLAATDDATPAADLVWSIPAGTAGGTDASSFVLSASGVLAFTAAKDYENPDDTDTDGVYEVTVQVSDGTGSTTAALLVTLSNVPELTSITGPSSVTFAENSWFRVATFTASSEEDRAGIAWTLGGSDAARFSIDSPPGALRFALDAVSPGIFSEPPDFEVPVDGGADNTYELTLSAAAGGSVTDTHAFTVTVTDVDEEGALSLSSTRPALGSALTAVLTDPDGVTGGTAVWRWERSTGRNAWAVIAGAAAASYTPPAADTNAFLRVTATYADGHGTGKTVSEVAPNVVTGHLLTGLTASTDNSLADGAHRLYPAFDPETLHYGIGCNSADTLAVTVSAAANARVAVAGVQAGSASMSVDVSGDSDVAIRVTDATGAGTTYVVHCLADGFFNVVTHQFANADSFEDLILFSQDGRYFTLMDRNGVPRYRRAFSDVGGFAVRFHRIGADGAYRYGFSTGAGYTVLDEDFEVVGDGVRTVAPLTRLNRHDFQILENGNYLLMAYEPATRDFSDIDLPYADGADVSSVAVQDSAIQIVTPQGQAVFNWNSWDYMAIEDCVKHRFPLTLTTDTDTRGPDGDYAHINGMHVVDGVLAASMRGCSKVLGIDVATGDVVWRMGRTNLSAAEWAARGIGPRPLDFINDPEGEFCGQHTARFLPNGHVFLLDNGVLCTIDPGTFDELGREGFDFTRAVEYALDLDNHEAVFVRDHSLRGERDYLGYATGNVDALDNGDWLVSWGRTSTLDPPLPDNEMATLIDTATGREELGLRFKVSSFDPRPRINATVAPAEVLAPQPVALAAEFPASEYTSGFHTGAGDAPQVVVAFNRPLVDFTSASPSVSVSGAAIDSVSPHVVAGEAANAYVVTLTPTGDGAITVGLVAGEPCASAGICTADGAELETTPGAVTIPGPVTASVQGNATVAEGGSTTVLVTLQPAHGRAGDVEVPLSTHSGSTAVRGSDYDLPASVTFGPADTASAVTLTAAADSLVEGAEAVEIAVGPLLPGGFTAGATATVTIADATDATLTLTVGSAEVAEGNATDLTFSAGTGITFTTDQTIAFTLGGTAQADDYRVSAGGATLSAPYSLILPAGENAVTATMRAVDDASREDAETVVVDATHGAAVIGTRTVTIPANDRDLPQISVRSSGGGAEGVELAFRLTRAGTASEELTVAVRVAETGAMLGAAPPAEVTFEAGSSTATLTLATTDDPVTEQDSEVTVTVLPSSNDVYDVGSPQSATVTVEDNDVAMFDVTAMPGDVVEGGVAEVRIATRNGVVFATAQDIGLEPSGGSPEDYTVAADGRTLTAPYTLTLPPLVDAVTATLRAVDDAHEEGEERVVLTARHAGETIGSATIVIVANDGHPDTPPAPMLRTVTIDGDVLILAFGGMLDEGLPPPAPTDFTVRVDGTARAVDLVVVQGSEVRLTLGFSPTRGATVTVDYAPGTNPLRDTGGNAVTGFAGAKAAETWVTVAPARADEGEPVAFPVRLSRAVDVALTLDWTIEAGSATAGGDYPANQAGTVTIAMGTTSATIEVATVQDASHEPDETFTVQLTAGTDFPAWAGLAEATATGTIVNDDSAPPLPGGGGGGGSANRPPVVEREIDDQTLTVGEVLELDIRLNFYDRDQRALDYRVESADPSVAEVEVDRNGLVTIHGIGRGVTEITVTAADRREESVSQTLVVTVGGPALVALVPRAADTMRQGFVRVINHAGESGEIAIEAIDDTGMRAGPIALTLNAGETVHFNSNDLEDGNAAKGLADGVGPGEGDWRLVLASDLDFEVLSYIRTEDGFLTAVHDTVPRIDGAYRVAIFNPGENPNQVSRLRVINPGEAAAVVTVSGIDDAGATPGTSVMFEIAAGESLTLTASDLETGAGVDGALGNGVGKWRLQVSSDAPIEAMSLLSSPTGHLTNLSTVGATPGHEVGTHVVPLFPSASDPLGRQGFVRVVNRSTDAGEVRIESYDDSDFVYDEVTLAIGAGATVHFNSNDLELGNTAKGLSGSTGAGVGDWWLDLSSDLELDVLAYIRTDDGFLTSMHDVAPVLLGERRVAIFNPGSNRNQVSRLRLVNPGDEDAVVTVTGVDDAGRSPGGAVTVPVPAGASRTIAAADLEAGGEGFAGALGVGTGKWRLAVTSAQSVIVMSLLSSPTGHLTNLSTAPDRGGL